MFTRRVMFALAAGGSAAAISFLPATTSSAGGTDEACGVEPVAGPPDSTAPPDSVPPLDDAVDAASPTTGSSTEIEAEVTPTTEVAVDVDAAPATAPREVGGVPPTTELADVTATTEVAEVAPTTEVADVAPTTEVAVVTVDSLPDLTTSAGEGASGLRARGRIVTAEQTPPPRQIIDFKLEFVVNNNGSVSLKLSSGTLVPSDPCKLWPGSTLTADPVIAGHYTITFPQLKGRNCENKDVVVTYKGKVVPHIDKKEMGQPSWILVYTTDLATPQIVLYDIPFERIHLSQLDIKMKCTVLVPRQP